ncbi:MAG: hypothetical protein ABIU30_06985, partial [Ferruginibacter sp.]
MKKYSLMLCLFIIAKFCAAQVPVSQEPMHHNVFENSFVRVLDVHVPPGDTSLFHKHETPSVFIVLTPVKTGSEVIIESGRSTALLKDSAISFESFAKSPRIHRVWNEDNIEFHVMDVEILNKDHHNIAATPKPTEFRLLFEEVWLRGYRVTLNGGSKIQLPAGNPFLVVCLDDASDKVRVNKKSFNKKGDYLFVAPGQEVSFSNED